MIASIHHLDYQSKNEIYSVTKYTKQGTDRWLENPDEDRRSMLSGLLQQIGGQPLDLSCTRGEYDVSTTGEARSSDTITNLELSMIKTEVIAEMTILEDIDLNALAKQGAQIIVLDKAPGK